jgi:predicted CoA-binding protein
MPAAASAGPRPDAPSDDVLRDLLIRYRHIAVVGLSPNPARPSHRVAAYMRAHGYDITPVNPVAPEVLGIPSASSLADAATRGRLEIVNIFRRPSEIPGIVEAAIALGAKVIWMQLGLADADAAARARAAGVEVVMDRCIQVEHARLIGGRP